MTKEEVTKIANHVFGKISEHYGYSKHHATLPYLVIDDTPYSDAEADGFGEYRVWDNEIILYWTEVDSFEEICRTLIHEYQHYLQSPAWLTRYYTMGYGYDDHPYEIAALREEENWEKFY
jgi:hypothetical protein